MTVDVQLLYGIDCVAQASVAAGVTVAILMIQLEALVFEPIPVFAGKEELVARGRTSDNVKEVPGWKEI